MTDKEKADSFFKALQTRGFKVERDEEGDWAVFGIHPSGDSRPVMVFCFYPNGDFARISGYVGDYWADEIDLKKY